MDILSSTFGCALHVAFDEACDDFGNLALVVKVGSKTTVLSVNPGTSSMFVIALLPEQRDCSSSAQISVSLKKEADDTLVGNPLVSTLGEAEPIGTVAAVNYSSNGGFLNRDDVASSVPRHLASLLDVRATEVDAMGVSTGRLSSTSAGDCPLSVVYSCGSVAKLLRHLNLEMIGCEVVRSRLANVQAQLKKVEAEFEQEMMNRLEDCNSDEDEPHPPAGTAKEKQERDQQEAGGKVEPTSDKEELLTQLIESEKLLIEMERRIASKDEEIDAVCTENRKMKKEVVQLERDLAEAQEDSTKLEKACVRFQKQAEEKRRGGKELQDAQETVEAQKETIEHLSKENKKLASDLTKATAKAKSRSADRGADDKSNMCSREDLLQAQLELAKSQRQVAELEERLQEGQGGGSSRRGPRRSSASPASPTRVAAQHVQRHIKLLEQQLEDQTASADELLEVERRRSEEMQKKILDKNAEIERLSQLLTDQNPTTVKEAELYGRIADLQQQVVTLTAEVNAKTTELAEARVEASQAKASARSGPAAAPKRASGGLPPSGLSVAERRQAELDKKQLEIAYRTIREREEENERLKEQVRQLTHQLKTLKMAQRQQQRPQQAQSLANGNIANNDRTPSSSTYAARTPSTDNRPASQQRSKAASQSPAVDHAEVDKVVELYRHRMQELSSEFDEHITRKAQEDHCWQQPEQPQHSAAAVGYTTPVVSVRQQQRGPPARTASLSPNRRTPSQTQRTPPTTRLTKSTVTPYRSPTRPSARSPRRGDAPPTGARPVVPPVAIPAADNSTGSLSASQRSADYTPSFNRSAGSGSARGNCTTAPPPKQSSDDAMMFMKPMPAPTITPRRRREQVLKQSKIAT